MIINTDKDIRKRNSYYCWWECSLVQPLWNLSVGFLKNTRNIWTCGGLVGMLWNVVFWTWYDNCTHEFNKSWGNLHEICTRSNQLYFQHRGGRWSQALLRKYWQLIVSGEESFFWWCATERIPVFQWQPHTHAHTDNTNWT